MMTIRMEETALYYESMIMKHEYEEYGEKLDAMDRLQEKTWYEAYLARHSLVRKTI